MIAEAIRQAQRREKIDIVVLAQLSMSVFIFSYPDPLVDFGVRVLTSGETGFRRAGEILASSRPKDVDPSWSAQEGRTVADIVATSCNPISDQVQVAEFRRRGFLSAGGIIMPLCRLMLAASVFFALAPLTALGKDLPAWTVKIRKDHPRLFFNAETWPEVRDRALGAEKAWHQKIQEKTDRLLASSERIRRNGSQELGPEAAQAAFVYLVTGDGRYLDLARKCLRTSIEFYEACYQARKTVNWYSTSRVHAVMAWDWLYNHLDEKERVELMSRLVRVIDNVDKAKPAIFREHGSGYKDGFYGIRNCFWFIGCTAFGTGIETEKVNEWLVWGHDENLRLLEHRKTACGDDGGGASATLGYVFGAYPWSEQNFFYTWLSATGENIAPNWPHGAWLANYVLWNWIEADPAPYQFGYGDTPHDTNTLPTSQLFTHMANIRHLYSESAPEAAALARYLQTIVPHRENTSTWFIYPFLLSKMDRSPAPFKPEQLPHGRNFEAMGQVFVRSGTTAGDTYCLFTCGGILAQHRHYDALNFVIYHRGFLALDSGTRYSEFENGQHLANYFAQTVAHNCVVIHQPGEPPARYWGGTVTGCHGGQHRAIGSTLKAFQTSEDYVYVAGDGTACYRHGAACGEKAALVTRQLVFLMPNHFVICDRVSTTAPQYRKDWLLHTAYEPQITGKTIRADHLRGRMFCRTLLPADARLTVVGGLGKEFWAAGQNWSIKPGKLKPEELAMMGQWRVEVTPPDLRSADVFLHLIQVGDQGLPSMDKSELVQFEGLCGVRVARDGTTWEVTFNTTGDLGGHLKRTGAGKAIDVDLADSVQPQSGILARQKAESK